MAEPDIIALALLKRMVEAGVIDMGDINAIADELEAESADAAHQVRMAGLEAGFGREMPQPTTRPAMRLVRSDGGKPDA